MIDDGGLLNRYRSELGLRGPVMVTSPDLDRFLDGLAMKAVQFAVAGGATHGGAEVGPVLRYAGVMPAELIRRRHASHRGPPEVTWALTRYLREPCAVVDGSRISRQHLIQYISNKMGGVHWDPHRTDTKAREAAFVALDSLTTRASLVGKNPVYFELLAVGQCLVKSPQVTTLLDE